MYMSMSPFIMMCYIIMLSSSLMALSSSNWLIFWACMEINLLSFIPVILYSNKNQETEASIKYFLAQALGSAVLLMFSVSMWNINLLGFSNYIQIILLVSLLMKLGSAPCHFWYPSVMSSIPWISCLLLTTWQKLAPLCAISFFWTLKLNSVFLISVGSLNALVGGIMGLNQSSLRSIMAYSSIGHIGWMLSLASISMSVSSLAYFVVYCLMVLPMFLIMNVLNISSLKNMSKVVSVSPLLVFIVAMLFMSLGGLPPLTGFLPKMMTIYLLISNSSMFIFLLILGSVMNLCFYLNIIMNFMSVPNITFWANNEMKYISVMNIFFIFSLFTLVFILIVH